MAPQEGSRGGEKLLHMRSHSGPGVCRSEGVTRPFNGKKGMVSRIAGASQHLGLTERHRLILGPMNLEPRATEPCGSSGKIEPPRFMSETILGDFEVEGQVDAKPRMRDGDRPCLSPRSQLRLRVTTRPTNRRPRDDGPDLGPLRRQPQSHPPPTRMTNDTHRRRWMNREATGEKFVEDTMKIVEFTTVAVASKALRPRKALGGIDTTPTHTGRHGTIPGASELLGEDGKEGVILESLEAMQDQDGRLRCLARSRANIHQDLAQRAVDLVMTESCSGHGPKERGRKEGRRQGGGPLCVRMIHGDPGSPSSAAFGKNWRPGMGGSRFLACAVPDYTLSGGREVL